MKDKEYSFLQKLSHQLDLRTPIEVEETRIVKVYEKVEDK